MPSWLSERRNAEPFGAFPMRAPFGKIVACIFAVGLLPLWWKVDVWTGQVLAHFYLETYARTMVDAVIPTKSETLYYLAVKGPAQKPVVVDEQMLRNDPSAVRLQAMRVPPRVMHGWLEKWIYHGNLLRSFWRFLTLSSTSIVFLVGIGGYVDVRRRRRASLGAHRRGTRLVSWRQFNRRAPRSKPGIVLPVTRSGKLKIAEELLAYHFNIFGSTGMGKSTVVRRILHQVEARGETAILYDPKGEYLAEFYSPERGDIVLDPGDQRCPYWELEGEAEDEAQATPWAMAFWPDEPGQQMFFKRHPRSIFAFLVSRFSAFNEPTAPATCASLGYWLTHPRTEIARRIRGTEHAVALGDKSQGLSEQSQGLYTTLGEIAKPLRMMPVSADGRVKFSVREWSKKRRGWIFMTSTPTTVDALLPIHSAILDMLILSNQSAENGAGKMPRCWFVLDEVATLQRLPQLESGATKQRASGNPIILGFHDQAQLITRYGIHGASTIMSQAYTNIILRCGDPTAAKHVEQVIGHAEIERLSENRPVHMIGRHNRSRSWSSQVADSAVVTAAEIQGLPRFHGYVVQEGMCVSLRVQNMLRASRSRRIPRVIPPLIFREKPEVDGAVESAGAAVDDQPPVVPPPPPMVKRKRNKNPLIGGGQMELAGR